MGATLIGATPLNRRGDGGLREVDTARAQPLNRIIVILGIYRTGIMFCSRAPCYRTEQGRRKAHARTGTEQSKVRVWALAGG